VHFVWVPNVTWATPHRKLTKSSYAAVKHKFSKSVPWTNMTNVDERGFCSPLAPYCIKSSSGLKSTFLFRNYVQLSHNFPDSKTVQEQPRRRLGWNWCDPDQPIKGSLGTL
jgi:hypothetical protein